MPSRTFTVADLDDLEVAYANELKISNGSGRWSEHFDVVFRDESDGKLFVIALEEGLTEMQDYYGSDRYPDSHRQDDGTYVVDCDEVELYEELVPVTKWRAAA